MRDIFQKTAIDSFDFFPISNFFSYLRNYLTTFLIWILFLGNIVNTDGILVEDKSVTYYFQVQPFVWVCINIGVLCLCVCIDTCACARTLFAHWIIYILEIDKLHNSV